MNILLRILVILTLILNGVALWFAISTNGKRMVITARNDAFRDFTVEISKQFEDSASAASATASDEEGEEVAAPTDDGTREERDISEVSRSTIGITPDKNNFWDSYNFALEQQVGPIYTRLNVLSLDEVFILDAEGKPVIGRNGLPETKGAPMERSLNAVIDLASAQLNVLRETRKQLITLRKEYETTVAELNRVKALGRDLHKTIQEREETISTLESEKAELNARVAELTDTVSRLESEKADLESEIAAKDEQIADKDAEIERLNNTIEKIMKDRINGGANTQNSDINTAIANVTAGEKGEVVLADNSDNFCIIRLDQASYDELLGPEHNLQLPKVDFLVKTADGTFVGKIRLRTVIQGDRLIMCDVLSDWKQVPFAKGQKVIYLD